MQIVLGSGAEIDFWFDPWSDNGILCDVIGVQAMSELGGVYMKVSHYINADSSNLPLTANAEINKIWVHIRNIEIPKTEFFEDRWVWKHSATGDFPLTEAYKALRVRHLEAVWTKILWPPTLIPKNSCCSYKAIMGQLLTKDRMGWLNINMNLRCVLCNFENESYDHLFFACAYSS